MQGIALTLPQAMELDPVRTALSAIDGNDGQPVFLPSEDGMGLAGFNPDQARDEHGRWGEGAEVARGASEHAKLASKHARASHGTSFDDASAHRLAASAHRAAYTAHATAHRLAGELKGKARGTAMAEHATAMKEHMAAYQKHSGYVFKAPSRKAASFAEE